jgi:NAD(P)-dependent dehydrogenase (short-subunit alcohol dehydrogenase family)
MRELAGRTAFVTGGASGIGFGDPASVERAAQAAYDAFGNVHVVCDNAGVAAVGGIDNISPRACELDQTRRRSLCVSSTPFATANFMCSRTLIWVNRWMSGLQLSRRRWTGRSAKSPRGY